MAGNAAAIVNRISEALGKQQTCFAAPEVAEKSSTMG